MANHRIEWHGDEAIAHVRRRAVQFITRACITVVRRAKQLLSVAGSGRVKGKAAGPAVHSKPGESPYKQTGRLRASVTYEIDETELEGRVGTNVEYGRHLELGTRRGIAPRPWLRRALLEMQSRVNELLSGINEP